MLFNAPTLFLVSLLSSSAVLGHGMEKRRANHLDALERRQQQCAPAKTIIKTVYVTSGQQQQTSSTKPASSSSAASVKPTTTQAGNTTPAAPKPSSSSSAAATKPSNPVVTSPSSTSIPPKPTSTSSSAPAPAPTSPNTSGTIKTSYTGKQSGDATFYGNDGSGGNCKLPARADLRFVAFPGVKYGLGERCGACIAVTGAKGTEVVQITNKCPECAEGALDLSTAMFEKIVGAQVIGRANVSWKFVDCVSAGLESGKLSYFWKSGSSQYWAGVQVRGGSTAIASVEVKSGNGAFIKGAPQDYNYFVSTSGFGAGPFTIRTTFQDGTVKTDTNVPLNGKVEDA